MSLPAPRLTTPEPPQSQPPATPQTVRFHSLEEVVGTARFEAATVAWTAQPREYGRDRPLIGADQKSDDQKHQGARIKARFARRNHSSSSCR